MQKRFFQLVKLLDVNSTEFQKWILPSLNLDTSTFANRDVKNKTRMSNSVDSDETAHLDLHCLHIGTSFGLPALVAQLDACLTGDQVVRGQAIFFRGD